MGAVTFPCGEDVHTRGRVVHNRHVAVENLAAGGGKNLEIAGLFEAKAPVCEVTIADTPWVRPTRWLSYKPMRMSNKIERNAMSAGGKPRAGQSWRPPRRRPKSSPRAISVGDRPGHVSAVQTRLAADLAVPVEQGLVVPVHDGETLRYAVNPEDEGDGR